MHHGPSLDLTKRGNISEVQLFFSFLEANYSQKYSFRIRRRTNPTLWTRPICSTGQYSTIQYSTVQSYIQGYGSGSLVGWGGILIHQGHNVFVKQRMQKMQVTDPHFNERLKKGNGNGEWQQGMAMGKKRFSLSVCKQACK